MLLYGIKHGYRGSNLGGGNVGLWWVPIGLAAWFGVAVVAALFIGPALRHSSEAREALEQQLKDMPDGYETSQDERQAFPGQRGLGASDGQPSRGHPASARVPAPSDGADPYRLKRNSTRSRGQETDAPAR
jgi:hypothetical protein